MSVNLMKNSIIKIGILLSVLLMFTMPAFSQEEGTQEKFNSRELIIEHLGDAYDWHITTINGHHVSVYLPVIVYSKTTGWHVFMSSKFHEGESYENLYIAQEGEYAGKIVEKVGNEEVRPFDISITKNVCSLLINCLLLVIIILYVSSYYKKKSMEAPTGFRGIMEMLISSIYDGVIKENIGKDADRYAPYLLTVFFFIFLSNLMGLIPIFPGGANLTGNIAITFTLALCTFLAVNLFGNKEYWKEILWPDVPLWMKPLMALIEIFGIFTKPFTLMIRLFANIMAGHSIMLGMTCIIFLTASISMAVCSTMSAVAVFFMIFMNCLELLVAFIQAYVFTMLSSIFIGLSRVEHENEH